MWNESLLQYIKSTSNNNYDIIKINSQHALDGGNLLFFKWSFGGTLENFFLHFELPIFLQLNFEHAIPFIDFVYEFRLA